MGDFVLGREAERVREFVGRADLAGLTVDLNFLAGLVPESGFGVLLLSLGGESYEVGAVCDEDSATPDGPYESLTLEQV